MADPIVPRTLVLTVTILCQGEGDGMKQAMEPLLYAAGVDIVFAGPLHAYERSV